MCLFYIAADVTCPTSYAYLPNPSDCASYYQCSNGVPYYQECAPGNAQILVFDPNLNVCVHPRDYACQVFACSRHDNPTTCLSSPNNCSYCCDPVVEGASRCDTYDNLLQSGCQSFDRTQYGNNGDASSACTHIKPGQKKNITVTFSIEKHPLDLYYLMDTTGSMADDKDNLVSLSSSFLATLLNLTNDFRIGFGTFKDKPMFPSNPNE